MPLTGSEGGAPLRRIHVWAPVAFAHLRSHRCGVLVRPEVDTIEAFCHEPPTHRAEIRPLPPYGSPVTALCARHAVEAARWPTVTALTPFHELAVEPVPDGSGAGDCQLGASGACTALVGKRDGTDVRPVCTGPCRHGEG